MKTSMNEAVRHILVHDELMQAVRSAIDFWAISYMQVSVSGILSTKYDTIFVMLVSFLQATRGTSEQSLHDLGAQ